MRDEDLTLGPDGITLGHYYESVSNEAYPDPATGADPWTCGIGCTGCDSEGIPIVEGTYWDDHKVDLEYKHRMDTEFMPQVKRIIKVEMEQKEFDAMVDLCFNIGWPNFEASTLAKKFNAGDKKGAADEFPKWNKAGGKVMKGLQRRRWAERVVFLGGDATEGIREANQFYP